MIARTGAADGGPEGGIAQSSGMGALLDIELPVTLRFGRTQMLLENALSLRAGSVVELDRRADEPVDVLVNGKVVARGEAVTVQGSYAIRILEVGNRPGRNGCDSRWAGKVE
jgi:flagellar motor switch protein FliN/FliY